MYTETIRSLGSSRRHETPQQQPAAGSKNRWPGDFKPPTPFRPPYTRTPTTTQTFAPLKHEPPFSALKLCHSCSAFYAVSRSPSSDCTESLHVSREVHFSKTIRVPDCANPSENLPRSPGRSSKAARTEDLLS
jgi:hypothetical protein